MTMDTTRPQPHRPARRPVLREGVLHVDLCIIGAGSGGLSVAAGAAQMGASVVLAEKHAMGGDCLNTGCVPSKALLAAAHAAEAVRGSGRFGVNGHEPAVDFAKVHAHVHGVIAAIAPHDSVERFEGLGVTVIQAAARFTGPAEVEAGGTRIRARRFVLATGSAAAIPPVPGLAEAPYLTNETIFGLTECPGHLIVLGGGPIGVGDGAGLPSPRRRGDAGGARRDPAEGRTGSRRDPPRATAAGGYRAA
jgi:pyruvate/2-oxoglutarate dehydrogenase complex dihydrolipoamide dehydrogenase (E3) component